MKTSLIIAALLAASLYAQPPGPPPPPELDAVQAYLTLTGTQLAALDQIHRAEEDATQLARQDLASKRQALQQALNGTNPDSAAAAALLVQISAARKQLDQVHATFQAQAIQTLTPDQKTKLKALEDASKILPVLHQAAMLDLVTPPPPPPSPGAPPRP